MDPEHKFLGVITARGGSKGLPRKNVLPIAGKPMIGWTIEAALASRHIDRLVLTSDDPEIIDVATGFGCEAPFVRPAHLAGDEAVAEDVLLHCLDAVDAEALGFTHIVLLQPTSPLRDTRDIDAAIALCLDTGAAACVSVTPVGKSITWLVELDERGRMHPLLDGLCVVRRRQDAPDAYTLNGAVYVGRLNYVRTLRSFIGDDTVAYVMPPNRSHDIDTAFDLLVVEAIMTKKNNGRL